jgi:ADP-ribose pyrophosphatase
MGDESNGGAKIAANPGRFLTLMDRGGWEYCSRRKGDGAAVGGAAVGVVGIVAITREGKVLLIEQVRVPLGKVVVEIPAGLVVDHGAEDDAIAAAKRELMEETGFVGEGWRVLAEGPTSAGMSDEVMTLVMCVDARRVGPPQFDGEEQIVTHEVALGDVAGFVEAARRAGKLVDIKVPGAVAMVMHRGQWGTGNGQ